MDAAELEATIARLDEMRARCDAVVKRENCKTGQFCKPLQPDRTVGRKRLRSDYVAAKNTPNNPPINTPRPAMADNYRTNYRPPRKPTFSPRVVDMQDGSIDAIFADFEAAFDEMAQAHRA